MYELMIKNPKKNQNFNKNFFMGAHVGGIENVKTFVSHNMVNSLSSDILDMANFMTQTIMEGLADGRK